MVSPQPSVVMNRQTAGTPWDYAAPSARGADIVVWSARSGYVPSARLLPPAVPALHVERPRLETRLDESSRLPLTALIAGTGFGKSTTLAAWARERRLCWYTCSDEDARLLTLLRGLTAALRTRITGLPPELASAVRGSAGPDTDDADRAAALAALLAEAIDAAGGDDLHLVIDDAERLPADSGGARLLGALVRQSPARLRLLVATRDHLPITLRHHSDIEVIASRELSFMPTESAQLLASAGITDPSMIDAVHRATAGWPAAVRLAAEALRDRSGDAAEQTLGRLNQPGGLVYTLLVEEVLDRIAPLQRRLVSRMAVVPRVTARLCGELGVAEPEATLLELERRGLVLDHRDADGWHSLPPMVRAVVLRAEPLAADDHAEVARTTVHWLREAGRYEDALQVLRAAELHDDLTGFLEAHGLQLVATGACQAVVEAVESLAASTTSADLSLVEGHARQVLGDWEGALDAFGRATDAEAPLPPGIAWRMGLIHHFRGDLQLAIATYDRGLGNASQSENAVERAHLLAWSATARWLLGDVEGCRTRVTEAAALARGSGDAGALAITHTTQAMVAATDGDRRANDTHYMKALVAAEEAGDVLQLLRIRCNRGSRHLEEGAYHEAIEELELALRLAEASGYAALHALSLCNRAEAHRRLGRLEEAAADYETARALYQRIESRLVGYALSGLGDVHRIRGDLTLARAAYEEAVEVLDAAGDAQGLGPALAGLARVVAATDLRSAASIASRAIAASGGLGEVEARLAAGFVTLATGDRTGAAEQARSASDAARRRRDRAGLAESLELGALTEPDRARAISALEEAIAIWEGLDEPIGAARAALAAARMAPSAAGRTEAALAVRRLRDLGITRRAADAAGTLREITIRQPGTVEIQALGSFAVRRDGIAVSHSVWQSRKARDLLKVLIARRGRPTAREQLIALLWPDEDPERTASRLSGVLSIARAVFDPDKSHPPDTYIIADRDTVSLNLERVAIDVEGFLATAAHGLALRERDPVRARLVLEDAEASYTGDVLEEDPYEDWTVPLREEARATYIAVARAVAEDAADRGDADRVVRCLLRILERDPFDERAHHDLIRALTADGRHGEAQRRYRAYVARMGELGVPGEPFATIIG